MYSDVILIEVKVLIMGFILGCIPRKGRKTSLHFLFQQRNLLVKMEKGYTVPDSEDMAYLGIILRTSYIRTWTAIPAMQVIPRTA